MRTPAAIAALPVLAGAALGLLLGERLPDSFAFASAAAAALAAVAAAGSIAFDLVEDAVLTIAIGLMFAGASLGASAAAQTYRPPLLGWFESRSGAGPISLEGVLGEDAALTPFGLSLTLGVVRLDHGGGFERRDLFGRPASLGGVRLSVAGALAASRWTEWRAGRLLRVTATLRRPAIYLNPGGREDRRALARRGVILVGSVKSAALVEVLEAGSIPGEVAAAIRAWTRSTLAAAIGRWRPRSAAIATAILIGDRTGLSEEDSRRLQEAGTYHVIAISGGNIAILTVLLLTVMRIARLPHGPSSAAAIAALLFYALVTTSAPSVDRAIAASVLYLSARLVDLRTTALNALGVAALIGIAAAPTTLIDPGFILSFGATLGILVSMTWVGRHRAAATFRQRVMRAATAVLLTSLATEIALLPAGALFFSRVTFAGLILNFAAIPLMTVLQIAAMAVLVTQPLAHVSALCALAAHFGADGLIESARLVEYAPWLSRDVVTPAWWLIAAYYISIVALVALHRTGHADGARRRRMRLLVAGVACGAGVLIVIGPRWSAAARVPAAHAPLRIVFLDVGQGDATAVLLPGGRALLVDAGGMPSAQAPDPTVDSGPLFDVGDRVVAPALRALGIRRIETLAITHADPDHIGGALSLMRAFRPRAIWEGVPVPRHAALGVLAAAAETTPTTWRILQAGDVERVGPVVIRVLHPPRPDWERQRVRNEDSIVLDVRIGDVSVILPGDIGREGEQAILSRLEPSRLVVLKAPHHGSATSSTQAFLGALAPAAVVFSAGRSNRFGHPHPGVVARYRSLGTHIFSTAEDGAVILDTDGEKVELRGWTGRAITLSAVH